MKKNLTFINEGNEIRLGGSILEIPLQLLMGNIDSQNKRIKVPDYRLGISGLDVLMADDKGMAIFGQKEIGKGKVFVFTKGEIFSQIGMGDIWGGVEPGGFKNNLFDLEYMLLDKLIK